MAQMPKRNPGLRGSLLEGVKIHHHHIDGLDAVLGHHGIIGAAPSQQAAMDARVQGLDAPVHDFRKAGVAGHFRDRDAGALEQACRTAG